MKNTIKLLTLVLSILFITSCASKKTLAKEGIVLMEGADLFYEVNSFGSDYTFEININNFDTTNISFDYDLGGGTKEGTVSMTVTALEDATTLYNYFSGGYINLRDKTSVWISKQLFIDLKAGKLVEIELDKNTKEVFKLSGSETYSFGNKNSGVPYNIPVFIISSESSDKEIWIADDYSNRLIVKMNIGFKIDLVDYKPYK